MHKYSTVLLLSRCKYVKLLIFMDDYLGRFPSGRAIRCIFFACLGQKKDAAFIANAALEFPFLKNDKVT